jgi:hypothetical protein
MGDFLARFDGGELIGLVAVGGGLLIGLVAVIAAIWRSVRVAELEAHLKQQMLGRGMSAAEIEQVLKSSSAPAVRVEDPYMFTGNVVADKATLIKLLVANDYKGDDIARVLQAFDAPGQGRNTPEATKQVAELVGNLVQQGLEAVEIDKVLRGFQRDRIKENEGIVGKG